jgi:hypothetical protein
LRFVDAADAMTHVAPPFLVPACLYALVKDARRAAGPLATALVRGKPLAQAAGPLVEVSPATSGLVVVGRYWSSVSTGEPQFHIDLPWKRIVDKTLERPDLARLDRVVEEALSHAWAFTALAGSQHYPVVRRAATQLRFLEAARTHWSCATCIGPRYSTGQSVGQPIEKLPSLVRFCLTRQGSRLPGDRLLTSEVLEAELENLPGFQVRSRLLAGDVAGATELLRDREPLALLSLAELFFEHGQEEAACRAVELYVGADPHGFVKRWLSGRGDLSRTV